MGLKRKNWLNFYARVEIIQICDGWLAEMVIAIDLNI